MMMLLGAILLLGAGSSLGASTIERSFRFQGKQCTATFATPPSGATVRLVTTGAYPYLAVRKGTRAWESYPRSLNCRGISATGVPGRPGIAARGLRGAVAVSWTVPSGGGRGLATSAIELRGARGGGPLNWDQMVPLARLEGGAPGRRDQKVIALAPGTWRLVARAVNNSLRRGALSRPVLVRVS